MTQVNREPEAGAAPVPKPAAPVAEPVVNINIRCPASLHERLTALGYHSRPKRKLQSLCIEALEDLLRKPEHQEALKRVR
jgi:hypothetical protein